LRFFVAVVVTVFSVSPAFWRCQRAVSHLQKEEISMSTAPKPAASPERSANAAPTKTRVVTIALKHLPNPADSVDEFAHRFPDKYKPENLEDLIDSIKTHGLLEPPLVSKRKDGAWEVIGGHRRLSVLFILANRGLPGFGLDMLVHCLEILDAP